jgi:hypothetical protein
VNPRPCEEASNCRVSPERTGQEKSRCWMCRLSPDNSGEGPDCFLPVDRKRKHPVLEAEKRARKRERMHLLSLKRLSRNKGKQEILRQAARAEKETERKFLKATRNSGRTNKDGDHVLSGRITLDTKHQSTRENPVVLLQELDKVRADAAMSNMMLGALVIRTKNNVGVVAVNEQDFARLVKMIEKLENQNSGTRE